MSYNNIIEHVLLKLYNSEGNERDIDAVLEILGKHYDVSRVYIFEDSADGLECDNTFEWCAKGIAPQKENFQHHKYCFKNGENSYYLQFDDKGVFYCPDVHVLSTENKAILEPQGIHSVLQCVILDGGRRRGFIGYDECRENRVWKEEQVYALSLISKIVGTFLFKIRQTQKAAFSDDFCAALDNSSSYIALVSPDTYEVFHCNHLLRSKLQISEVGGSCYNTFYKKKAPCSHCPMELLKITGKTQATECQWPDGSWILSQASPLRWHGQELVMITCTDITRQKQTEEKLRQKTAELNSLIHSVPGGIFKYSANEDEEFSYISKSMLGLLGYTAEEFKEKFHNRFSMMVYHKDRKRVLDEINQQIAVSDFDCCEYRIEAKNGELKWVHDVGHIVTDTDGKRWFYVVIVDITQQKQIEQALRERNAENAIVIRQSGKNLLRYDLKRQEAFNYGESATMFGLPDVMKPYPESLFESGIVLPESENEFRRFFEEMQHGSLNGGVNAHLRLANGEVRWFHADYTLILDDYNEPSHSIISFYDNTEEREEELAYEMWQNNMNALIADSVFYLEANLSTDQVERTEGTKADYITKMGSDLTLSALLQADLEHNIFAEDAASFLEFFDRSRLLALYELNVYSDFLDFRCIYSGCLCWTRVKVQMVKYPFTDQIKIFVIYINIDEERKEKEKLIDMASCDSMTGLFNRTATMNRIEQYLLTEGANESHALFMIDIDNFKTVNDTFGHQLGDTVISTLASTIRHCFRDTDIIGRIGGDEFFVFMKNTENKDIVLQKARELITALQYLYACGNKKLQLSGSVGISMYEGDPKPLSRLYEEADAAVYRAKARGKSCFVFASDLDMSESNTNANSVYFNLYNLIHSMNGGITIYHGDDEASLRLAFYNNGLLDILGGMTKKQFMALYGSDVNAGIHPQDKQRALSQPRAAYRMKGADEKYYWVSSNTKSICHPDGSLDVIHLYIEADSAIDNKCSNDLLTLELSKVQKYQALIEQNTVACFSLDLTSNWCGDGISKMPKMLEMQLWHTVDALFACANQRIPEKTECMRYQTLFNREYLLQAFQKETVELSMEHLFSVAEDKDIWVRTTVNMIENLETRHVEALFYILDINYEKNMQLMLNQMVGCDYEYLSLVDAKTGIMTSFGETIDKDILDFKQNEFCFDKLLKVAFRKLIPKEYYEESIRTMCKENIVRELEKNDTFTCCFPTQKVGHLQAGFKQWQCGYIGNTKSSILISRKDVTEVVSNERDVLTGLYNRPGFYRHVRKRLDTEQETKFRLVRFDIDNFKMLNDVLGVEKGDELLRNIGLTIQQKNCDQCTHARMDADHFISFMPVEGRSAEEIFADLNAWFHSYPIDFRLTIHMGVYYIDQPELEVSIMCDRALLAMRSIKGSYSKQIAYYDDALRDRLVQEQKLSGEITAALKNEQFEVYFQPQVNYDDSSIIGAEALVRWNHPTQGILLPAVFVPLFERNGLITALDQYVWEKSCRYIRKWMDDIHLPNSISISVNISRIDIYDSKLCETLKSLIHKYKIPASLLRLEITESAYIENPEELINIIGELQREGFTIEMDDFGSGYSSLNTLKDVPVDILKLDVKFLSQCVDNSRGGSILSSVIRMAHWLKLPIIAEGVETKQQADYLKSLSCFYMQGYLFWRPMPAEEFESLMVKSKTGIANRFHSVDLTGAAPFWDPSAQTTLLFNSFVGGAAILEYENGKAEILRANDKFYTQLGTTREAYLDKQLHTEERFEGEYRNAFIGMIEEAIHTGDEAECEVQSFPQGKNGNALWTHNRARILCQNGKSYLLYLAAENITQRKNIEMQLRVSKDELDLAISHTGTMVCHYDVQTRTLTMSEEYARLHGLERVIKNIPYSAKTVFAEDYEKYIAFYEKILRGEESGAVIVRFIAGNNVLLCEELKFSTVFDDNQTPIRAVISIHDVAEQIEREAENERLRLLIERTGFGVFDYDVILDVLHSQLNIQNRGVTKLDIPNYCEYLSTEKSLVHPDSKEKLVDFIRTVVRSKPVSGTFEYVANNWGTGYRLSRLDYATIADAAGEICRIVGQICDIQREMDHTGFAQCSSGNGICQQSKDER